jgi:hypothetical protein
MFNYIVLLKLRYGIQHNRDDECTQTQTDNGHYDVLPVVK